MKIIISLTCLILSWISPGAAMATSARPIPPRLTLAPCHVPDVKEEVRCGVLRVQENRARPNGNILPLRIVVIPARTRSPAPDPVFYFEGGPGQAATQSASYVADLWVRDTRDVVLVDQRGTADGHRLSCRLDGTAAEPQGYLNSRVPALRRCASELALRADVTQYVTPIAMQDIDEVRRALRYEKINVYGGSYGSRAAMIYTKMYGEHVRTAYLSAVVPLSLRMPLPFAWSAQRALDEKLKECSRVPACREEFPHPEDDLAATLKRLAARPERVQISRPANAEVFLSRDAFSIGLMRQFYTSENPAALPAMLKRARNGDFKSFTEAAIERERSGRDSMAWGMHRIIVCSEDVPRIKASEVPSETAGTFLGSLLVQEALEICRDWPVAKLPRDYFRAFRSNVPALITSGEYDPVTPPRWGEEARRSFPNSLHIVTLEGHHFDASTGCLNQIARRFLESASVGAVPTRCVGANGSGLAIIPSSDRVRQRRTAMRD